ncbi:hypothetical protein [Streptomyces sp. 1222.5]|uniref:hypothetical protein n=1 Tax=Streptomyces sp. 1222.5 TaxID=1881026 RepID=UPI003D73F6D0
MDEAIQARGRKEFGTHWPGQLDQMSGCDQIREIATFGRGAPIPGLSLWRKVLQDALLQGKEMVEITGRQDAAGVLVSAIESHSARHTLGLLGAVEWILPTARKGVAALQGVQSAQSGVFDQAVPIVRERLATGRTEMF